MDKPEFTDGELNLISIVLQKADPTGIISDAQSAIKKLQAYGQELAAQQENGAKPPVAEKALPATK